MLRSRTDSLPDHSPAVEFRADVKSDAGYPIFVRGSLNRPAKALGFQVIHRGVGRIYGLCLGKDHHNPTCRFVGETHKHSWSEAHRDKSAYAPEDITASVDDPVQAWKQFCSEARIRHTRGSPAGPVGYGRLTFRPDTLAGAPCFRSSALAVAPRREGRQSTRSPSGMT